MDDQPTRWDEIRRRFQNSWLGVGLAAIAAVVLFSSQLAEGVTTLTKLLWPKPTVSLKIQKTSVAPLPQYARLVPAAAQDAVYPVGARLSFDLRHDENSEGEIRISHLNLKIDDYKVTSCPFSITGDRLFGAGTAPVREFIVLLSKAGVTSVQRTDEHGTISKGNSGDLLSVEPPVAFTLGRSEKDSGESFSVAMTATDPGQYAASLWVTYSTPQAVKEAKVAAVTLCKPGGPGP